MPEAPPRSSRGAVGAVSHSAREDGPAPTTDAKPVSATAGAALDAQKSRMESLLRDDPEFAFHVGTLPECPRYNIDLAGISFPRTTERVELRGGETIRTPMAGAIVRMTEGRRKAVLQAIAGRVVRFRNTAPDENTPGSAGDLVRDGRGMPQEAMASAMQSATGTVIVMDGNPQRPYRPQRGDKPLADFVYMERRADLDASKPSYPKPLSASAPAAD